MTAPPATGTQIVFSKKMQAAIPAGDCKNQ
jgi:hypothetical protein